MLKFYSEYESKEYYDPNECEINVRVIEICRLNEIWFSNLIELSIVSILLLKLIRNHFILTISFRVYMISDSFSEIINENNSKLCELMIVNDYI